MRGCVSIKTERLAFVSLSTLDSRNELNRFFSTRAVDTQHLSRAALPQHFRF
jgi:hypothetical protein